MVCAKIVPREVAWGPEVHEEPPTIFTRKGFSCGFALTLQNLLGLLVWCLFSLCLLVPSCGSRFTCALHSRVSLSWNRTRISLRPTVVNIITGLTTLPMSDLASFYSSKDHAIVFEVVNILCASCGLCLVVDRGEEVFMLVLC